MNESNKKILGILPNFKGNYDPTISYNYLNEVFYGGSTFRSKVDNNTNPPCKFNPDGTYEIHYNWQPVAIGSITPLDNERLDLVAAEAKRLNDILNTEFNNIDNTSDLNKPISNATKVALDSKVNKSLIASRNGLATLDSNGVVPTSQLNPAIISGKSYKGSWDASTNTPNLTSVPASGFYYIVSKAGNQFNTDWNVDDTIISNGTAWEKITSTASILDGKIVQLEQKTNDLYYAITTNSPVTDTQRIAFTAIKRITVKNGKGKYYINTLVGYVAAYPFKLAISNGTLEVANKIWTSVTDGQLPPVSIFTMLGTDGAEFEIEMNWSVLPKGIVINEIDTSTKFEVILNPLNKDYINKRVEEIGSDINYINVTSNKLDNRLSVLESSPLNKIDKIAENSEYISGGYFLKNGKYVKATTATYGINKYKVNKGDVLICAANKFAWYDVYACISFSTTDNLVPSETYAQVLMISPSVGTDIDYTFVAEEDGYLYTQKAEGVSITAYKNIATIPELIINRVPLSKNILCFGSSITWGSGYLGYKSFVGEVENYYRNKVYSTVYPEDMVITGASVIRTSDRFYRNQATLISGINSKFSFKIDSEKLHICQVIDRTNNYAIAQVRCDGLIIGTFDNMNRTIGSDTETFSGVNLTKVQLKRPFTRDHNITVNGTVLNSSDISINTSPYGASFPADKKAWVYRGLNPDGDVVHYVEFRNLGTIKDVRVGYTYSEQICYTKDTRMDVGSVNESPYGSGSVSFDPANPSNGLSSGLEFRSVNMDSYISFDLKSKQEHDIEIEIIGGVSPYLIIDHCTSHIFGITNAGIGGWSVINLINNDKVNDWQAAFNEQNYSDIFIECGTNDDWAWLTRKVSRTITNVTEVELKKIPTLEYSSATYVSDDNFTVVKNTGIIKEIGKQHLVSDDIKTSTIVVGDIVRIGNYYGDNRSVVCREIKTVDKSIGKITWDAYLPKKITGIKQLSDFIGMEFAVRDLSSYYTQYKTLIDGIKSVNADARIHIVSTGASDYWMRQLWGYDIVHKKLCALYGNMDYVAVNDYILDYQDSICTGNTKEVITATGASNYTLTRAKHYQGVKVLVDGVDVYGIDCHIVSGFRYCVDQAATGSALNFSDANKKSKFTETEKLQLVFTRNVPSSGKTIEVIFADTTWSSDYCHPWTGLELYGKMYINAID